MTKRSRVMAIAAIIGVTASLQGCDPRETPAPVDDVVTRETIPIPSQLDVDPKPEDIVPDSDVPADEPAGEPTLSDLGAAERKLVTLNEVIATLQSAISRASTSVAGKRALKTKLATARADHARLTKEVAERVPELEAKRHALLEQAAAKGKELNAAARAKKNLVEKLTDAKYRPDSLWMDYINPSPQAAEGDDDEMAKARADAHQKILDHYDAVAARTLEVHRMEIPQSVEEEEDELADERANALLEIVDRDGAKSTPSRQYFTRPSAARGQSKPKVRLTRKQQDMANDELLDRLQPPSHPSSPHGMTKTQRRAKAAAAAAAAHQSPRNVADMLDELVPQGGDANEGRFETMDRRFGEVNPNTVFADGFKTDAFKATAEEEEASAIRAPPSSPQTAPEASEPVPPHVEPRVWRGRKARGERGVPVALGQSSFEMRPGMLSAADGEAIESAGLPQPMARISNTFHERGEKLASRIEGEVRDLVNANRAVIVRESRSTGEDGSMVRLVRSLKDPSQWTAPIAAAVTRAQSSRLPASRITQTFFADLNAVAESMDARMKGFQSFCDSKATEQAEMARVARVAALAPVDELDPHESSALRALHEETPVVSPRVSVHEEEEEAKPTRKQRKAAFFAQSRAAAEAQAEANAGVRAPVTSLNQRGLTFAASPESSVRVVVDKRNKTGRMQRGAGSDGDYDYELKLAPAATAAAETPVAAVSPRVSSVHEEERIESLLAAAPRKKKSLTSQQKRDAADWELLNSLAPVDGTTHAQRRASAAIIPRSGPIDYSLFPDAKTDNFFDPAAEEYHTAAEEEAPAPAAAAKSAKRRGAANPGKSQHQRLNQPL